MRSSTLFPMFALLAVAACQPTAETAEQAQARMQSESAAAKTAIDSLGKAFGEHFSMGHFDVVAGFYADGAHVMPPNGPTAVGKEAITASFKDFGPMKPTLTLTAESVMANGDLAIERGTYAMTFTPPGAKAAVTDKGKYMTHWHRTGGKWMIVEDMWNSDLPPMPMPEAKPAPAKKKM